MHAFLLTIAAAAFGVDAGWTPIEGGKHEYIIQIEPEQLDTLRDHKDLTSEVPPGLNIARYRITVGNGQLPRDSGTPATAPAGAGDIAQDAAPPRERAARGVRDPLAASGGAPTAAAEPSTAAADAWPPIPEAKTGAEPNAREARPSEVPRRGDLPFSFGSGEPKATDNAEPKAADHAAGGQPTSETPFSAAGSAPASETPFQDRSPAGSEAGAAPDASASVRPELGPAEKGSTPGSMGSPENPPGDSLGNTAEKSRFGEREAPRPFPDNQVQQAVAHKVESASGGSPATGASNNPPPGAATAPSKQWMPLVGTLLALCVSLGGNAYMGWVTWIARMRYRGLVDDLRGTAASSA